MTSIAITFSVVAIGIFNGLLLACKLRLSDLEYRLLLIATCSYFNYLLIAAALFLVDKLGVPVFSITEYYWLIPMVCFAGFYCVPRVRASKEAKRSLVSTSISNDRYYVFLTLALLYLVCFFILIVFQNALLPLSSWDGLGHWSVWPRLFTDYHSGAWVHERGSIDLGDPFPLTHRHPLTLVRLVAYSSVVQSMDDFLVGWMISWTLIWCCGICAIFASASILSRSRLVAALTTVGYMSFPLLENHSLLVGYAELWITVAVTLALSLVAVGVATRIDIFIKIGLLLSATTIAFKNTGFIYFLSILIPVCIFYFRIRYPVALQSFFISSFAVVSLLFSVIYLWFNRMEPMTILGTSLEFNSVSQPVIRLLGGRQFVLDGTSIGEVLINHAYMFFVNGSFTVCGLTIIVSVMCLSSASGSASGECLKNWLILRLLTVHVFALVIGFAILQFSTEYSARYASPTSDTGASRFLLPVSATFCLILSSLSSLVTEAGHPAKTSH